MRGLIVWIKFSDSELLRSEAIHLVAGIHQRNL